MKKYVSSVLYLYIESCVVLHCMLSCSDIHRCEESTSSPGVPHSIGEGIIEEDEEVEEESNKKRMKEDDQEVLSFLHCCLFVTCMCFVRGGKVPKKNFFHTGKKGKHLHLASGPVKDRKILGGLVQRPVCPFSHLLCAKTASARRLELTVSHSELIFYYYFFQICIWTGSFDGISGQSDLFG